MYGILGNLRRRRFRLGSEISIPLLSRLLGGSDERTYLAEEATTTSVVVVVLEIAIRTDSN